MSDNDAKKSSAQGLELFFAMYAIGLVFGIEQISDGTYRSIQSKWGDVLTLATVLNFTMFISILLLIIRFFWSTGNIRRALARSPSRSVSQYTVLHLPVLLFQGVLVMFLCFCFTDSLTGKSTLGAVLALFTAVTAWNAIWLKWLVGNNHAFPESFWLKNNVGFVFCGCGLLALIYFGQLAEPVAAAIFVFVSITSSVLDLFTTAKSYLNEDGY